jgi:hypothetical protein
VDRYLKVSSISESRLGLRRPVIPLRRSPSSPKIPVRLELLPLPVKSPRRLLILLVRSELELEEEELEPELLLAVEAAVSAGEAVVPAAVAVLEPAVLPTMVFTMLAMGSAEAVLAEAAAGLAAGVVAAAWVVAAGSLAALTLAVGAALEAVSAAGATEVSAAAAAALDDATAGEAPAMLLAASRAVARTGTKRMVSALACIYLVAFYDFPHEWQLGFVSLVDFAGFRRLQGRAAREKGGESLGKQQRRFFLPRGCSRSLFWWCSDRPSGVSF